MSRSYLVLLICHKTTVKKHIGEANLTSASMKGACESPPVGAMLVLPLLFFYAYTTTVNVFQPLQWLPIIHNEPPTATFPWCSCSCCCFFLPRCSAASLLEVMHRQ